MATTLPAEVVLDDAFRAEMSALACADDYVALITEQDKWARVAAQLLIEGKADVAVGAARKSRLAGDIAREIATAPRELRRDPAVTEALMERDV